MCGRFALFSPREEIARQFGVEPPADWAPRYNIAPSTAVLILRRDDNGQHLGWARWGLVPSWAKSLDSGYSTINARAETVAERPAYRAAFRRRRCLLPADGYYEWQSPPAGGRKRPFFIGRADGALLALAGLWERWEPPGVEPLESCTIIVGNAIPTLQAIHDRMPIVLDPAQQALWLDPELQNAEALGELLRQPPSTPLRVRPVSHYVNSARNEGPACLAEPTGAD